VSRSCLEAVLAHVPGARDPLRAPHPWYVLAQFADAEDLQTRIEQALAEREAVIAQSLEQARSLWRLRESIPEAQFANVKHDISLPVSKIPEFIAHADQALKAGFDNAEIYCFGHVGDGNLHYNIGPERLLAQTTAVNRVVYDAVARLRGSISAEHGLGQLKRADVRAHKDPLELELMRALKTTLDPQGLMNPGKVL